MLAPDPKQLTLPFSAIRNSELLAIHWFENRLPLEPEWEAVRPQLDRIATALLELWAQQKTRVERYGNEASLEQAFIQPVFQILGWKLKYQTHLQGRAPDYALFIDDSALDAALAEDQATPEFWRHATIVADAKAWHISLDRPTRRGAQREYPPEQIEWYLDRSRLNFGILTNGKLWRLVPRELAEGKPRFKTYLETDLPALLERLLKIRQLTISAEEWNDLRRFILFYSPIGFSFDNVAQPLVLRAVRGSAEYSIGVGDDLKERVFDALPICIEGFLAIKENQINPDADLTLCKEQSLILLYRLLFIMFAEDRGLLPYRINRTYTENRSLARHRDEIAKQLDATNHRKIRDFSKEECGLWADLCDLFDLIDQGHRRYGVPPYDGGLFDPERNPFLAGKQIPDWHLARVIDQLGRAGDPAHPRQGLFRVDYRDLTVQQLGGVYEGLLELVPHHANTDMIILCDRRRERALELVHPATEPLPAGYEPTGRTYRSGSVYLQTDKGERRSYGSYYTPDRIVSYIVENTLGPLCSDVSLALENEIGAAEGAYASAAPDQQSIIEKTLQELRRDFGNRILKLRILDPAMGSGHFLVRACQYLAEEIATNPNAGDPDLDHDATDESTLTYWKRRVVEACIFGVDLNPMAVELAKLALWLDTVSVGRPLSFLDHHLLPGNSLVGARLSDLGSLPDAPPILENMFGREYRSVVPEIVRTLVKINELPSDTPEQVKEKDRLLRTHFRPLSDAFRMVGDLWCSFFFYSGEKRVTPALYDLAVQKLGNRATLHNFVQGEELQEAVNSVHTRGLDCFHWELEFPDIFEPAGPERGFDAIIGNPPYDMLSDKELERDLSQLKAYIAANPVYGPSRRKKNNLYKLFMCRFIDLLREGGRLGAILPMALLGDDISAKVRRMLVQSGAFTKIDALPQKDDARRRVFPDAKLSTCIIAYTKTQNETMRSRAFSSQIHPEDRIERNSPQVTLTTAQIPLYDPENFAIVSCSQADWDLAIRIVGNGRMVRLRDYVEFFQGEVNETNQRKAGNLCDPKHGCQVIRGANICLYVLRPASQGAEIYLDRRTFLRDARAQSKAFHHRYERVGIQESSPQNNFRRVIAGIIPKNEFCNHKINYAPEHTSKLPLRFLAGLLNSNLIDWYFRLGSTNAAVSHYQLYNLPCPRFAPAIAEVSVAALRDVQAAIADDDFSMLEAEMRARVEEPPFDGAIPSIIAAIVDRIIQLERERGNISRSARSRLAPKAQSWQLVIDNTLALLAGITPEEHAGLRDRLATML